MKKFGIREWERVMMPKWEIVSLSCRYGMTVTTNVIEVEFWDASCAHVDELRLRHDFDDLCECL